MADLAISTSLSPQTRLPSAHSLRLFLYTWAGLSLRLSPGRALLIHRVRTRFMFMIPEEQLGISVSKIRPTSWTHLEDSPVAQVCVRAKSLQLCLTLCDPIDCSPSGSSVHGILQAKILQWVAIPSSRGSSQPRGQTHVSSVSCRGRQVLYH